MRPPQPPVFLERASYRQRRMRDAARMMPVVGILLWTIPLLWPRASPDAPTSAFTMLYFFGVWVVLILLSALLSYLLRRGEPETVPDKAD